MISLDQYQRCNHVGALRVLEMELKDTTRKVEYLKELIKTEKDQIEKLEAE